VQDNAVHCFEKYYPKFFGIHLIEFVFDNYDEHQDEHENDDNEAFDSFGLCHDVT
jgi:hypothetical protein